MPKAQQEIEAPEAEVEEELQISDEDLLSAIDEELSDEQKPEVEVQAEAEAEAASADDAGDEDAAKAAEGDGGEPVPEGSEEVEAKPAETEGDEKPEGEEPVSDVEAKPEEEPEPEKEAKPSDEFGELDKDVPEKTRERFDTLKERYDSIVAERDTVKAEADKWVEAITSTGTNPEQFGMALTWLQKINSKDPRDLEDAYEIMSRELGAIGKALGKPINGADPLADHADLKAKVDEGLLDEESAQEIAQARATQKLSAASQQHRQQESAQQATVQKAMADVKALGAELMKNDPDFQAKIPYLTPIIESVVSSGAPATSWVNAIRIAVAKIPVTRAAPPAPKPTAPNPIRPGGTSPANAPMQREPGSAIEALNQSLERGY